MVQKDRHPGTREEDKVYFRPGSLPLEQNGEVTYKEGVGFRFQEEGTEKGLTGTGITEPYHENIDSLVHNISEDNDEELTRTSGRVSNVTQWTQDPPETRKKIRETGITRSSGRISQVDIIQYDDIGVEKVRKTGVITRTGGRITKVAWTEV